MIFEMHFAERPPFFAEANSLSEALINNEIKERPLRVTCENSDVAASVIAAAVQDYQNAYGMSE